MIKVGDLVDVTGRDIPLLIHVDDSQVLHLVRKDGYDSHNQARRTRYQITDCNKALEYTRVFTDGTVDSWADENGWDGRLCPRCGNREKFQEALSSYHRQHVKWRAEYEAKKAAEQAEYERQWELTKRAARDFCQQVGWASDYLSLSNITAVDGNAITAVFTTVRKEKYTVTMTVQAAE